MHHKRRAISEAAIGRGATSWLHGRRLAGDVEEAPRSQRDARFLRSPKRVSEPGDVAVSIHNGGASQRERQESGLSVEAAKQRL